MSECPAWLPWRYSYAEFGQSDTASEMTVHHGRHDPLGYDIRTEVAGASGKVVVEDPQKTPLTFSRRFGFEGDHFENFPDRFAAAFRLELEAFIEAIRDGRQPSPGPDDALETLRLALACRLSQAEGRPVRVADVTA